LCSFHPTASNVLASAGADFHVKLFDIEKGSEINSFEGCDQLIHDVAWDYSGRLYAVSSKDKIVRLVDARSAEEAMQIPNVHEGAK
jgi:coronin-1B/1C/6